jgi:hypothetical protein
MKNTRKNACRAPLFALLALLLALPVTAADAPADPATAAPPAMTNNVLLVGWDGAHREHVRSLLAAGRLPNLASLVTNGALVDIQVTSGATDTKAGWTQILTGYRPEVTGVYNNRTFRDAPAGCSLFERIKTRFGTNAVAAVAVIGKRQHCGEIDAPFRKPLAGDEAAEDEGPDLQPDGAKANRGRTVVENGRKFLVFDGSPYYTMHFACDAWLLGLVQDARVGDRAIEMLDRYGAKPFFFFVHFAEVDHSGHQHGESSRQYDDAIVSNDAQLGRLVARLKERGLYDRTLIYVTADHGFDRNAKAHSRAPLVFLATNDRQVMRNGTRADVAPTILDRLGFDLAAIRPPLDSEPLTRPALRPAQPGGDPKKKNTRPGVRRLLREAA